MRYRLIPTRGVRQPSQHVVTDDLRELDHFAEVMSAELDMPVLVCEAPEGGLVERLYVAGSQRRTTTVRRRV